VAEAGTLYVLTAYAFNHLDRGVSLDERLFDPALNPVFYFVGDTGAPAGFGAPHLVEADLNPGIVEAGARHLAEWTFLLTELERPFARYPFYVVSSRFHEKNTRLEGGLARAWPVALEGLARYGWGYLPSYERDAGFQDLAEYRSLGRLGMCDAGLAFVDGFWGVRIPDEYRLISDFFSNYIGFQSRAHLEQYVGFYLPFIRRFFDERWNVLRDPELYVRRRDVFRNEKPFTLLLEMVSHMFFHRRDLPFAGVSYDGLYEVSEREAAMRRLRPL